MEPLRRRVSALFGEAPSAKLRRPAQVRRTLDSNPFNFADSEYA
jgi:hypothetical protein